MNSFDEKSSCCQQNFTVKDKKNRIVMSAALGGYIAFGFLLALFIPENILEQPWAAAFVAWMADYIPQIAEAGIHSPIPDVAQFHSAVMWLLIPIVFIVLVRNISDNMLSQSEKEYRKRKWFMLFGMVIFVPVVIYFLYDSPASGPGRISQAALSSRLGLGLMQSMTFGAVPFFCFGLVTWCRLVPRVYFKDETKH